MLDLYSGIWRRCVWSLVALSLSVAIGERTSFAQTQEATSDSGEELSQPEAVELEDLLVSAERITPVSGAATALVTAEQVREYQARDVAEALKSRVPGVTGKRSGGINLDPIIRGLREDRLSVMTNGTKIWGGGPSRMDPPTSLLDVDELEAIEVIKGPYSVTRGPSSIGGTINLVTKKPELSPHWDAHGSLGAAYTSNYNGFTTKAAVSAGGPTLAFRLAGSYRDYQDYDSGDGERMQSGFQSQSVSGTLLWQPHAAHRLLLSLSRESDQDTRFDALPLHMEEDDAYLGSVSYTLSNPFPFVGSLQLSGYYNYVHHRMNNDHKPHRAGSGAGGGAQDGSSPGMQAGSGHPIPVLTRKRALRSIRVSTPGGADWLWMGHSSTTGLRTIFCNTFWTVTSSARTGPCNLRGFRNIDHATLFGADLGLSYALRENLSLHGSFAYVHGENEADDRALPEIPPLEGQLGLRYEHPRWDLWFNPMLRLVQSQHRVDSAFGEDATQGHVTVDIGAGWRLFGRHELMLRVENLFDKNYNEHITRENPFSGREVFEPGRVVTVGLWTTF